MVPLQIAMFAAAYLSPLVSWKVQSRIMNTNEEVCKLYLVINLTSPCSVVYVSAVPSNRALPSLCGELAIILEIVSVILGLMGPL